MVITLKDSITKEELKDMFIYVANQIVDSEDYLTEIDKRIGDGDHGTGMSLGFREVIKELSSKSFNDTNEVFQSVGITLLDTMGGASGVLFGTVFISGIVDYQGKETINLKGFAEIFTKSLEALKRRGKANVGDKTMIDALQPAVEALLQSSKDGLGLIEGFNNASERAKEGMEYTKQCVAKFGRAKSYGKKSIGFEDAGATSIWIIFRAMSKWLGVHCK